MAEIFGGALAMGFFGGILAWILRKLTGMTPIPSFIIGVAGMSAIGGWIYSMDGRYDFWHAWAIYAIGGAIVLPMMIYGEMRRAPIDDGLGPMLANAPGNTNKTNQALLRGAGWVLLILLIAIGSTSLFSAIRSTYNAELPFFIGVLCITGSFVLWRALNKPHKPDGPAF